MKKTTYAAVIKIIWNGVADVEFWGNWTDKETAAEVLENLKAAYAAFEITEELVMTTEKARELAEAIWTA
jgi:hypothetical protein